MQRRRVAPATLEAELHAHPLRHDTYFCMLKVPKAASFCTGACGVREQMLHRLTARRLSRHASFFATAINRTFESAAYSQP